MLRTRTVQVGFSFRQPCMDILRTRMSFSRLILLAAEEMFCPMSQNIHTTRFIERNVVCCCSLEHRSCEWQAACARIQQSGRSTPRAQRKRKPSIEQRESARRETAWLGASPSRAAGRGVAAACGQSAAARSARDVGRADISRSTMLFYILPPYGGADAASGFGSDDESDGGDMVSDGEDEAGEVYFTRRSIVPRVADERHWTTPPRRAPNALQIARASPQRPGTPRPGSTPPAASLAPMVLPPPATQSSSDQQ